MYNLQKILDSLNEWIPDIDKEDVNKIDEILIKDNSYNRIKPVINEGGYKYVINLIRQPYCDTCDFNKIFGSELYNLLKQLKIKYNINNEYCKSQTELNIGPKFINPIIDKQLIDLGFKCINSSLRKVNNQIYGYANYNSKILKRYMEIFIKNNKVIYIMPNEFNIYGINYKPNKEDNINNLINNINIYIKSINKEKTYYNNNQIQLYDIMQNYNFNMVHSILKLQKYIFGYFVTTDKLMSLHSITTIIEQNNNNIKNLKILYDFNNDKLKEILLNDKLKKQLNFCMFLIPTNYIINNKLTYNAKNILFVNLSKNYLYVIITEKISYFVSKLKEKNIEYTRKSDNHFMFNGKDCNSVIDIYFHMLISYNNIN